MGTKAFPSNDSSRSKEHEDKLAVLMTASLFTFPSFWLIHNIFCNRSQYGFFVHVYGNNMYISSIVVVK